MLDLHAFIVYDDTTYTLFLRLPYNELCITCM